MVVCGVCTLVNTPGVTECDACQTVLPACSGAANPRRKRALSPPPGRQIIELTSDDDDEPQLNESRSRATAAASSTNFEGASSSRGGGGGGGGSGARTRRRSRSPEVKVIEDESEKEALRLHWEEGRLKKDRLKALAPACAWWCVAWEAGGACGSCQRSSSHWRACSPRPP